jgi:hypothetical protein
VYIEEASLLSPDDDPALEPHAVKAVAATTATAAAVSSLPVTRLFDTMNVLSLLGTKAARRRPRGLPAVISATFVPTECPGRVAEVKESSDLSLQILRKLA